MKTALVLALVVLLAILIFWKKDFTLSTQRLSDAQKMSLQYEAALQNEKTPESEKILAIKNLSYQNSQLLEKKLPELSHSSSQAIRLMAVEAAGSFLNAGHESILAEALKSPDESLRISALKGLSRQSESQNISLLVHHLKQTGLTNEETYQALLSLMKIANEKPLHEDAIRRLLLLMSKGFSARPDHWAEIFAYASRSTQLIDSAKKMVESDLLNQPRQLSLNYLVQYDRSWILANLSRLLSEAKPGTDAFVQESLPSLCSDLREENLAELRLAARSGPLKTQLENFRCFH